MNNKPPKDLSDKQLLERIRSLESTVYEGNTPDDFELGSESDRLPPIRAKEFDGASSSILLRPVKARRFIPPVRASNDAECDH